MRHVFTWLFAFVNLIMMCTAFASSIPNHDDPTTFVGPTVIGRYTGWFTETAAYSVLAEAGSHNYRVGVTAGLRMNDIQRIKFSAEYLWQNITYDFFSGNTHEWVQQGAIGADYQFDLNCMLNPTFNLNVYASRAPSKSLNTVNGFYSQNGIRIPFSNARRIAGSTAVGISPGLDFIMWEGGIAGLDLNYDNVRYDKRYVPHQTATGFGGTVHIDQSIGDGITMGVSAAIRRPFNNYAAHINWGNLVWHGRWTLGLFGEYTAGKETLTSTYNAGLSLSYFLDRFICATPPLSAKGEFDYKFEAPPVPVPVDPLFLNWVSDPAVYMPQVLAIKDEHITRFCDSGVPTFIPGIGNFQVTILTSPLIIPTAPFFTGTELTYSITIGTPLLPGDSITINATTGVITATTVGQTALQTYPITVTATNGCGFATSNTFTILVTNPV